MELVEVTQFDQETVDIPFPSDAKKRLTIPKDLTRGQSKALTRMTEAAGEQTWPDYFEMVFSFAIGLPGASWNLAHKKKLLALTPEAVDDSVSMDDYPVLSLEVTKQYFPELIKMMESAGKESTETASEASEDEDDVMDGLEAEEGSQAASEAFTASGNSDPNRLGATLANA